MKTIAVLSTLLGLSTTALADTHVPAPARTATTTPVADAVVATTAAPTAMPNAYVALDGSAGVEAIFYVGLAVDGGVRIANTPLYAHGRFEHGAAAAWLSGDGTYNTARLGLEARACSTGSRICVFGGVDGGLRRAEMIDSFEGDSTSLVVSGAMLFPRAGLEAGGSRVRGRFAFELPTAIEGNEALVGAAVIAGVGYTF